MSRTIIKFPSSKRCFTADEEKEIRVCTNKIYNVFKEDNPFVTDTAKKDDVETLLAELIKKLYEMNEE